MLIKTHRAGTVFPAPQRRVNEKKKAPRTDDLRSGGHRLAFAGILLFTFLLYLRPNDLFPSLGDLPIVKTVTIGVLVIYLFSKLSAGERTILPIEAKMTIAMAVLAILFAPVAASPGDSMTMLQEVFGKVVIIFILLINLLDSRKRLFIIWKLLLGFGVFFAYKAYDSYTKGELTLRGERIGGYVEGMFGNPNDLATALVMLIPIALALFLTQRGKLRVVYLLCVVALTVGVIVTFSRGGFLGLIALSAVMFWKLGRNRRVTSTVVALFLVLFLMVASPGGFGGRISSVFNMEADKTGSASERWMLMQHTARLFLSRPILGVGMGNIHIYSIREKVAHNAYLEVAAELGVFGLIAYLIIILAPLRSLLEIERQTAKSPPGTSRQTHYLSICLQGVLVAYMVCSFFLSIQYQWFLYYPVAYAVALRRIHMAELAQSAVVIAPEGDQSQAVDTGFRKGAVWAAAQPRKGALIKAADSR